MSPNLEKIYEEALGLPDESKAVLAELIVEYLETHVSSDLERLHLDIVRGRKNEMKRGKVAPIDGHEASVLAHRIINK
ncbi:MAG TPA: addiction module protein [Desulfomonilaceae bacterium]|nr:addiction module protein [Desulfomonilaceae bacterium]